MVIGRDFVWAHIPKTGGDSVRTMYELFSKHIIISDNTDAKTKHDSFRQREIQYNIDLTETRKRIACFRRLPSFLLSYTLFFNKHDQQPVDVEMMKKGLIYWKEPWTKSYEILSADKAILEFYEFKKIAHWFRVEFLADDFLAVMKKFFPIPPDKEMDVRRIHINKNPDYKRDFNEWFTKEDLLKMYASCPIWASIEKYIYKGLITDQM